MAYSILILISTALLVGLFVLIDYEHRRGTRFFETKRAMLDRLVERAEFIRTHVDFKSFVRDVTRSVMKRIAHDVAHFSLTAVRATERLLTRVVKRLRAAHPAVPPRESNREFVKTLSSFKDQLKETPPEIPDILEQ